MFLELILFAVVLIHLWVCPYTKVEESFNLQAMHDIMFQELHQYDHLEFPGVVPRSFLGPIGITGFSYPFVHFAIARGMSKLIAQYIVRTMLGLCVTFAFLEYSKAIAVNMGPGVRRWLILITITQFHFAFYASRTLPNTFALIFVLLAVTHWFHMDHKNFIFTSAFGCIVFRSELALLLGLFLMQDLVTKRLGIWEFIKCSFMYGTFYLSLTLFVDSYFWRRTLWPEGEVWYYNIVLNKSSNWGTSPYLWYFYSALPRSLAFSIFLVPIGFYLDRRLKNILFPALGFVWMFSNLPHKELRFIIYTVPLFNTAAAVACNRLWINRSKSFFQGLLAFGVCCHLVANIFTTSGFLFVSHWNYPGGVAMYRLHELEPADKAVHVHIDVATAQTGVSRFTQINKHWRYDKTEDLMPGGTQMQSFTHLLIGAGHEHAPELKPYTETHVILDAVYGFDRLQFNLKNFPPVNIISSPKIWILKKVNMKVNTTNHVMAS